MNPNHPLAQRLRAGRPLLLDGAMGTMLHSRGFGFELCFDELNLTEPDEVLAIHRAYLAAGAEVLETNTFGANRHKLLAHGLEDQVAAINAAGVELAKRAIEAEAAEALVAGSIGPLGVRLAPFGRVRPEQAYAAFREQIEALVQAGADLLIFETHSDLLELAEGIRAAKDHCDLPVIAMMTFTRDDRTLLGDSATHVAEQLVEAGADIIGANCSEGPSQLIRLASSMQAAAGDTPMCVIPNAGWPERVADRIMYPATADYFADFALSAHRAGLAVVGGCCGTTPDHIRSMRQAIDHPPPTANGGHFQPIPQLGQAAAEGVADPTQLSAGLTQGKFVLSVEMNPPRGFSTHKVIAGAHLLAEAGADVINVADSPMARMRMSPWAICQLIQRQVELETVLHFPTRGRNLLRVQGDLLAAHALGVRNIFVVMGDPTAVGDYPEAMDNYDLVPTGLIRLIKHRFNAGVDHAGEDIGGQTSFFVGCALNLGPADPAREARLLHKKISAGADFALTQPVFEADRAVEFLRVFESLFGELPLPLLVGVLPLYNARHAAFLHNEVPGIQIPEDIQDRMRQAGERGRDQGVAIAVDLLQSLMPWASGAYLMPPFSRYDMAAEIIEAVRVPSA